ncbi:MAG TPA: DUF1572 domain-containing protein [Planctomycetes bacterium]|nr:DUF1572 domain-containing protein [Planctomycetota bacterium]
MKSVALDPIGAEFRRYKAMAEAAAAQLGDEELGRTEAWMGNSVGTLLWHIGGNLRSRFTDFLTSDGEKPWRDREGEFAERPWGDDRAMLMEHWERGWAALAGALEELGDEDLARSVKIRGVELRVDEALLRSLGHIAYHVGQIVLTARALRGEDWRFLTIPPGGSEAYNRSPTMERAADHAGRIRGE